MNLNKNKKTVGITVLIALALSLILTSFSHAGTASIDFNDQSKWLQQSSTKTEFVNGEVKLKTTGFEGDSNTALLIHGDSYTDATGQTITGNAEISNTIKKISSSFDFSGATYLGVENSNNNYSFGSNDFTIEMWIKPTSASGRRTLYSQTDPSNSYLLYIYGGSLIFRAADAINGIEVTVFGGEVAVDVWQHIALVRNGDTWKLYIDGVMGGSKTVSGYFPSSASQITIGKQDLAGNENYYAGHIEEIRVSKGIARWATNFTPPQTQYLIMGSKAYVTTTDANKITVTNGSKISSLTINNTQPANTNIKALVSFDGRATWKKLNGTTWTDTVLSNVNSSGMTIQETQTALAGYKFTADGSIDFAIGLESSDSSATPSISGISASYSIYKISNISIAGPTSVTTLNSNISYTASATKQEGTLAFEITLPNGNKVNSNTASYSFTAAGNYTLTAKAYMVEDPAEFQTSQINITVTEGQTQTTTTGTVKPKITSNLKDKTGANLSSFSGLTLKLQNMNGETVNETTPTNHNNLFENLNRDETYKLITTKTTVIPVIQNGNITTTSHITKNIRFDASTDNVNSDFFIDEPKASNVLLRVSGIPSDWTIVNVVLNPVTSLVTMDKNPTFVLTPSGGSAELVVPEMPSTIYKWTISNQDNSQTFGGTSSISKTAKTNSILYFNINAMKPKQITNIFRLKNANRTDGTFSGETINLEVRDQNNTLVYSKTITANGTEVSDTTTELAEGNYTVTALMNGKREMSRTVSLSYGPKTNTMTFTSLETIAMSFIVRDSRTGANLSDGTFKIFDKNGNLVEEKIIDGNTITANMVYGYPYKIEASSTGYNPKTVSIYPREAILKEITLYKK